MSFIFHRLFYIFARSFPSILEVVRGIFAVNMPRGEALSLVDLAILVLMYPRARFAKCRIRRDQSVRNERVQRRVRGLGGRERTIREGGIHGKEQFQDQGTLVRGVRAIMPWGIRWGDRQLGALS